MSPLRAAMLAGAGVWSLWLAWRIAALDTDGVRRRVFAMLPMGLAVTASGATWATLFWTI